MRTAPPIWRRLLAASDITLSGSHDLLQLAMGWTPNSHMHEFQFRGQCYGSTDPVQGLAEGIDERKVRFNLLVRVAAKIVYTYDFGDSWEHAIVPEKCLPVDANMTYPACTRGRGACPPEDCGGVGGFYNLLEALQDPRHPERKKLLEWVGRHYDPEKFSIDAINRILLGKKRAARSSG